VSATIAFAEKEGDGTGTVLWKSLLNALIVLAAILVTTIIFVILYKYRCLKIIYGWLITSSMVLLGAFGGGFFWMLLTAWNIAMDDITFVFFLWNFAIVGILAIFWHAPTKVNQGYLILISGLLAIFFTRLPPWTTLAILAIVAIYDIVAVLSPCGPLRVLVETAQQRQEPIPALLYNASVFIMMADQPAPEEKRKGVKLGLGDFIFYSVLIGRAALNDMITVFTCFVGIITGLFLTLLLLAIFRKALPALPISIALGILFYLVTSIILLPFIVSLGAKGILI
jgi:presenilin 1